MERTARCLDLFGEVDRLAALRAHRCARSGHRTRAPATSCSGSQRLGGTERDAVTRTSRGLAQRRTSEGGAKRSRVRGTGHVHGAEWDGPWDALCPVTRLRVISVSRARAVVVG